MVDVLPRQLGDVDEAVHAAEVDEGAEVHDARHDALADLARLEVGEEVLALLLLRLLEPRPARQHDVVAVLVELDDLRLERCGRRRAARSRTRRSSTSDAGRKPRRPMSRMRPPLTTSMTGPSTTPSSSLIFSIVPQARSYCARFFDRTRRPSLSSFWRTSASTLSPSDTISDGSTSLRIDSSRGRDDALGLVADVEQDLVLVDLDHRAFDDLAVLDLDHRRRVRLFERHAPRSSSTTCRGVVVVSSRAGCCRLLGCGARGFGGIAGRVGALVGQGDRLLG